jgi:hypothetical protein
MKFTSTKFTLFFMLLLGVCHANSQDDSPSSAIDAIPKDNGKNLQSKDNSVVEWYEPLIPGFFAVIALVAAVLFHDREVLQGFAAIVFVGLSIYTIVLLYQAPFWCFLFGSAGSKCMSD